MSEDELEFYGDDRIVSKDAKPATWLVVSYFVWIIWGFIWLALYWNGAWGWIDRGSWQELEKAANTTYPFVNHDLDNQK